MTCFIERFKYNPPNASYMSGFIDGDGCVFIRKIGNGYQSGISISQSVTNILQVIRYHFGGSITSNSKRNCNIENILNDDNSYHKYNKRNEYNLLIRSNEYDLLLDYIRHFIIIKKEQLECLYEFNKYVNRPNFNDEKEKLYLKCSELNKNNIRENYDLSKINNAYIQGLFDAEGCVYISKELNDYYISISQKNHPLILESIKQYLNMGKIEEQKKFIIYNKTDCLKFISLVKNGLIVKYNQIIAFENYLNCDSSNIDFRKQCYLTCNEEKHRIEVFSELNQNNNGKEGFNETMRLKEIKNKINKEIKLKQIYKEKSELMKGEKNHNYGKSKSEETRKKMSVSIRNAKNGISDETILEIRKLISEGKKNTEINSILNIPLHTISNVKNNKIVCRTENKAKVEDSKQKITQEQQNINRRKITLDEMIIVIDKTIEGMKPNEILNILDENRLKNQIKNDLTIDIIKNIRRNLTQNKLPFYKCEVSEEKYEFYKELIQKN